MSSPPTPAAVEASVLARMDSQDTATRDYVNSFPLGTTSSAMAAWINGLSRVMATYLQFQQDDLAFKVQQNGLADVSPLVFLNACRTAGDIPGLLQLVGWARQFMGAGAGAFIGSLRAVRSSSAKAFAEAFYRAMITDQMPLGAASLRARQAIANDPGDPTWLAYTVYGNPSASIDQRPVPQEVSR
jgi:hypothetical protein